MRALEKMSLAGISIFAVNRTCSLLRAQIKVFSGHFYFYLQAIKISLAGCFFYYLLNRKGITDIFLLFFAVHRHILRTL